MYLDLRPVLPVVSGEREGEALDEYVSVTLNKAPKAFASWPMQSKASNCTRLSSKTSGDQLPWWSACWTSLSSSYEDVGL